MRLPELVLDQLAVMLGLSRVHPLSCREVEAYLNRWVAVRYHGARGCESGGSRFASEPGWIVWSATVASKVARCPVDRWASQWWSVPAVELVAAAEWELRTVENELGCARVLRDATYRLRVIDYEHAVAMVRRIRDGRAWRIGIDYLARELAWCELNDASFGRVCRDIGHRVAGE